MDQSVEVSHLRDDMERQRAKCYRTVLTSIEMLSNGLDAMRQGKAHVLQDHADRVREYLTNLKNELEP